MGLIRDLETLQNHETKVLEPNNKYSNHETTPSTGRCELSHFAYAFFLTDLIRIAQSKSPTQNVEMPEPNEGRHRYMTK